MTASGFCGAERKSPTSCEKIDDADRRTRTFEIWANLRSQEAEIGGAGFAFAISALGLRDGITFSSFRRHLDLCPLSATADSLRQVRQASACPRCTFRYMAASERVIPFEKLPGADLHVDAVYLGGNQNNVSDDPLNRLIPGVGNQGGFRHVGSPWKRTVRLAVLYTSRGEIDWPDYLDTQTGVLTYYGDNRSPGHDLHDTQRGGNLLLRDTFDVARRASREDRLRVPPFLLFEKAAPGRAVRFRGLLAPGSAFLSGDDELAAIWRSRNESRFQNYRAKFTVLNVATVHRHWLTAVSHGEPTTTDGCPDPWHEWVDGRSYDALVAEPTTVVPTKEQQLPDDKGGIAMLRTIYEHFQDRPTAFEACAVEIWRMIAPGTGECDVTRPSRDGGRDAIGLYPLGPPRDRIAIDFAVEAKCYAASTGVGVGDVSRLISRLRPRNFGVFLTLSYFGHQVYGEVRSDKHPIAMVCGRDVIVALREKGYGDVAAVQAWLDSRFPRQASATLVPPDPKP